MTDRIVYGLALAACAVGLVVVALAWSDRRRGVPEASRLRHPATPAPVAFSMVHDSTGSRWLVRAPASLLAPLAVDIVTFRPTGSAGEWTSEPIIEPIVLEPGEEAVLPSVIADPGVTHDVVVAWTVRLPEGDVLGSRTITVPPDGTEELVVPPAETRESVFGPVYAVVAALLVVAGLVSAWEFVDGSSAAPADAEPAGTPTATSTATATSLDTSPTTTAAAAPTTEVPPTSAPVTAPVTTTGSTNDPTSTTAATSTTSSTSPATTEPTTTPSTRPSTTPTTTAGSGGREVIVRGRVEACRYGDECLIVGFGLSGDFALTGEYVCEFEDGSRFVFRYAGGGAEDACAAGGDDPSITIEVDGVRSPTVTRETATAG